MSNEVIAAIIALCGVILSAAVSLVFGLANSKYNYRQLYAETVSANRMDWINVWRQNVSKFLACAEIIHKHSNCAKTLQFEKEMYEARAMIVSRLNLDENDHKLMYLLINSFAIHGSRQDFQKSKELLLSQARKILKNEWERVKREAKGKKHD